MRLKVPAQWKLLLLAQLSLVGQLCPLSAAERVSGALFACLCADHRLCALKVTAKATVSALRR